MEINKLVFGGLVIGCLAAAGGGAYLATRQNVQATQGAAVTSQDIAADPAATEQAVTASEGVVAPEAAAAAPKPAAPAVRETRPPAAAPAPRPAATAATAAPAPRRAAPTPAPRQASARPAPPIEPAPAPVASNGGSMWETRPTVQAEVPEREAPAPEPVAPPEPEVIELVVPADAVMGLQLETTVSSERAKVEDAVEARVTRDVRVGGRVAIPAGSLVQGTVTEVVRGGKVRERARLSIRFHTVVIGTGDRLALRTDAITREGTAPGRESAAKIGGAAIGGAILGAILGGGKGAAIGAGVGAGGGTAAVMAGDRNTVTIPAGSTVSVRIQEPVSVNVEKE
jgi:type IV secretory pathway VirB10-like protein